MNRVVMVIGGGGRESVLVEKYSLSPHVSKIIAISGNDLMQFVSKKPLITFPNIKTTDKNEILKICRLQKVDLIDVSRDDTVAAGVSDLLRKNKFSVLGPSKKAGKIEWSKIYSRKLLKKINIPQPEFKVFDSQKHGIEYLKSQKEQQWFVKADGLAGGKGAMPAKNNNEAISAIKSLRQFGRSGEKFLLEKWIKNNNQIAEEFSAFALSDGKSFKILGYAQDHKRANDGDTGENTGGMGASFPPLLIDKNIEDQVDKIFEKTFAELLKRKTPYVGVLFLGGILIGKKVYVIEFNARWGDPEGQVIVPSIQNDFYELGAAVATGKLNNISLKIFKTPRVCVAVAPHGYPISKKHIGEEIIGVLKFLKNKDTKIYGAGIKFQDKKLVTTGGRALHVVGEGKNIKEAREKAYNVINKIIKEGNKLHYRSDIGWRDIRRLK